MNPQSLKIVRNAILFLVFIVGLIMITIALSVALS